MGVATVLMLLAGFALLVGGGEALVRGAGGLARSMGLSSLVIGLTVVAFATSAPELAVTMGATLSGTPSLAVGNVVGSNIVNVLLVLGASAVLLPLAVKSQLVRADIPVMVAMSAALLLLALDDSLGRLDGALLLGALLIYVMITVLVAHRRQVERPVRHAADEPARPRPVIGELALVVGGVVLLVVGAQLLVRGATDIAGALGMSELIIGLTVVAVGTSLPELATSVVAAMRGERDLAVGNVVGSNLFNIGAVLGLTAVVSGDGVDVAASAVRFDIPIMVAVSLALLPVAFTRLDVARWEGALFVAMYVAYVVYLLLETTEQDALDTYSDAMIWFVIPITALWLVLLVAYELGRRRGARDARRAGRR